MTKSQKLFLFLLRVSLGFMFLYAGWTKIVASPAFSAAGYIQGAKLFTGFYSFLLNPGILPIVNFVNEWGLLLLGASLILGIFVRLSSVLGAVLMLLYYFPLGFPYPNAHALIVDEHVIYAAALLFLAAVEAGRYWGLDAKCITLPICSKYPKLRTILG